MRILTQQGRIQMNQNQQTDIPIRLVEQLILKSLYDEPDNHWIYVHIQGRILLSRLILIIQKEILSYARIWHF